MRILMIAPVHRELEFIRQTKKTPFLLGQGQEGWYEGLVSLGHQVSVFRYSDSYFIHNTLRIYIAHIAGNLIPVWKARVIRRVYKYNLFFFEDLKKNKMLTQRAEDFKPQVILVSGGLRGITPQTIQKIKKSNNARVVLFSGVNPIYGASPYDAELIKNKILDAIFVNDAGYAKNWVKMGAQKVIILPISSADPTIHKKYKLTRQERKAYSCDIGFIGTLSYSRQKMLRNLIKFNFKFWGDIPPATTILPELKPFYQGKAYGKKMAKIYNVSKIVLNIHEDDMKFGGNMKTFEIPACGAFEMIDNVSPKWFVKDKEIVVYKSTQDLIKKIDYYLKHNNIRKKIAQAGQKRVLKEHLYKHHMRKMLQFL